MLIVKTGISKSLLELGLPYCKRNIGLYSISIIESFWVSIWIDCFRFGLTTVVGLDAVLRQILDWKKGSSGTTFGRFFRRFSPSLIDSVFIGMNSWQICSYSLTIIHWMLTVM